MYFCKYTRIAPPLTYTCFPMNTISKFDFCGTFLPVLTYDVHDLIALCELGFVRVRTFLKILHLATTLFIPYWSLSLNINGVYILVRFHVTEWMTQRYLRLVHTNKCTKRYYCNDKALAGTGFEPVTLRLWALQATRLLYPAIYLV